MAKVGDLKMRLIIGESSAMRPCMVRDKDKEQKAMFHCWSHRSDVVDASPMIGGHPGGVVAYTVGIVELENGAVCSYYPNHIRFLDTKALMEQYHFGDNDVTTPVKLE